MLQSLIVFVLVTACTSYAAWALMPAALRRPLALALSKLPLPGALSAALKQRSEPASGCACDGCDKGKAIDAKAPLPQPTIAGGVAPLVFHPRLRK